jgi:hypothetical protein
MKKIVQKIFCDKRSISSWLLFFIMYMMFVQLLIILDLKKTIHNETYLRMCPEPYVCVIPPETWKGIVPMGIDYYKRIEI